MEPTNLDDLIDQQKESEAQSALVGEQPVAKEPENPWVKLPRGRKVGDRWDTDVVVRELTGADEEALAKYRKNDTLLIDAVVAYAVESIGAEHLGDLPFDKRAAILRELLIGEREQLFIEASRATFGDEKELSYVCPRCQAENDITFSLSKDLPCRKVDDIQRDTYSYTTNKGSLVEYRPLIGDDQVAVANLGKGLSNAEQNSFLLAEIVLSVDGKPVVNKKAFVRNMGMSDRDKLLKEIIEQQPSPDLMLSTECPACENEVKLPLTLELVFRP
jgi:hypothetical protein